jgi:uncharacterized membrane protein YesL
MMAGLRAWLRALRHLNQQGYIYVWANVLWAALSLPVITAPAAWAGLVRMSRLSYTTPTANVNDFWQGFRENFRQGLALGLLNVVIVVVNISNLQAYREEAGALLRAVWLLTLFIWFAVQFYLWPIYYAMAKPSLTGAMRNAVVMLMLNPGFTLGVWFGIAVIVIFSMIFFPAWLLVTGGALAAIANSAVLDRLAAAGFVQKPGGTGEEEVSGL